MIILIVTEYFYPHFGGVEQVVREIGQRLASKNQQIIIFTTQEKPTSFRLIKIYRRRNLTVIRLFTPNILKRYLFPLFGFPFLLYYAYKSDLIHSANNYTIALPVFLAGKILNRKVTVSVWEIWDRLWFKFYTFPLSLFFWLYEKLILSLPFDKFIAPSRFVFRQIPQKNKVIIPLGHKNLKANKKKAGYLKVLLAVSGKFVFFYYGRFGKSKGIEYLIPAFAGLVKKYPAAVLILNISNLTSKIRDTINNMLINNDISAQTLLLSGIDEKDLPAYLTLADTVVIPDLTISFGLSALEASSIGSPIVTSTGGALPEVAYGKVIYIKPGSVKSLSQGLIDAYRGHFLNIPPKSFSWNKTAKMYQSVFFKTRVSAFIRKSNRLYSLT